MRGRRKAGQVEGQATNQGQGGSLPGRLKAPCPEFLENKSVYLVSRHGMGRGHRGRMQGRPRPPGFLFGAGGKSLPLKREEKEARKEEASQVIFQGLVHALKFIRKRGKVQPVLRRSGQLFSLRSAGTQGLQIGEQEFFRFSSSAVW